MPEPAEGNEARSVVHDLMVICKEHAHCFRRVGKLGKFGNTNLPGSGLIDWMYFVGSLRRYGHRQGETAAFTRSAPDGQLPSDVVGAFFNAEKAESDLFPGVFSISGSKPLP